jgi:hypothetical protein
MEKYRIDLNGPDFQSGYRGANYSWQFNWIVDEETDREVDNDIINENYNLQNLIDLRSWGANLVRWQISLEHFYTNGENVRDEYINATSWDELKILIDAYIVALKKTLCLCKLIGMKVVVVLMHTPGGIHHDNNRLNNNIFYYQTYYKLYVKIWKLIADTDGIKEHEALYAFDLINEPFFQPSNDPSENYYRTLTEAYQEVAYYIRLRDTITPISIESNIVASPQNFSTLVPLSGVGTVIYQFHMYYPHEFTHQGLGTDWNRVSYPGLAGNFYTNKEWLRAQMNFVLQFQKENPMAKIYVGEFSAIVWAEGAAQYLDDCISLFEEFGWDWTYHAFREWDGWDVEYEWGEGVIVGPLLNTERKSVLLKYFALNNRTKSVLINTN